MMRSLIKFSFLPRKNREFGRFLIVDFTEGDVYDLCGIRYTCIVMLFGNLDDRGQKSGPGRILRA